MITELIKLYINKKLWRKQNSHNRTRMLKVFNRELVSVGKYTYGGLRILNYDNKSNLRIGNFCSIAPNVVFLVSADHRMECVSTFPFLSNFTNQNYEAPSKGDIIVDDDVWVGYGSTIMSGVHIGQGAVIAAGAVVTKDVPPYAIVGGIPAKIIKYRFSLDMINELLKVDYSKLTDEMVKENIEVLYQELTDLKQLDWMPRKNDFIDSHECEQINYDQKNINLNEKR